MTTSSFQDALETRMMTSAELAELIKFLREKNK
jgi:hypothetical protein